MVALVMGAMIAHGLLDPATSGPWRMTLDTTAFFTGEPGERYKLGLGSSAALTVALASAIVGSRHLGKAVDLDWLRSLVAVHRAAQGGLGSGVDVAASLCGGTVRYQLDDSGAVAGVQPIEWPDTIFMAFVWTGQSASTGSFLERLEAVRASRAGAVEIALDRLATVTEQGIDALSRKDALGFLDSVDMFSEALESVGTVCSLPIISDPHRRLRRLAAVCGVHYKPSGAGGGDFGVCFSSDRTRLVEFSRSAAAEGFATPKVDQDPSGAEITGM
jgi:phosphomevalonate kinase